MMKSNVRFSGEINVIRDEVGLLVAIMEKRVRYVDVFCFVYNEPVVWMVFSGVELKYLVELVEQSRLYAAHIPKTIRHCTRVSFPSQSCRRYK